MSQQAVTAPLTQTARPTRKVSDVPKSAWAKQRERLAWLLVAPSVLVVAVVALYPLVQTFRLSFTNARFGSARAEEYVGFANYQRILSDDIFRTALSHTVVFTIASVAIEAVLGIAIALVINSQFRGRGLVRTAMLIPWAIMTVVSARLWGWMLEGSGGVINDLLVTRFHLMDEKIPWIARSATALPAMIAVDVWKTTPFMALLLLAGLQVIPGDIYEASTVDGASKWQQFWQMTLPMLRPALLVAMIFRTLDAFKVFDLPYVMKGGATDTITVAVYAQQTLVNDLRLGRSAAASVIIFLCIGVIVIIYTRINRVEEA